MALLLASAAALQGCAEGGRAGRGPSARPASPVALQELPPQSLSGGGCAMVVWRLADRRRVLIALGDPARARVQVSGKVRELPRRSKSGAEIFGLAEQQRFGADDVEVALEVAFDRERRIPGGVLISSGTLTYAASSGWESLTPVAGLIACDGG